MGFYKLAKRNPELYENLWPLIVEVACGGRIFVYPTAGLFQLEWSLAKEKDYNQARSLRDDIDVYDRLRLWGMSKLQAICDDTVRERSSSDVNTLAKGILAQLNKGRTKRRMLHVTKWEE